MQRDYLKRLVCDRAFIKNTAVIPIDEMSEHRGLISAMDVKMYIDSIRDNLVVDLIAQLPVLLKERVVVHKEWPKTWWDAFKLRWLMRWTKRLYARKRWWQVLSPVEYEIVDIDRPLYAAVCPHIKAKQEGPHLTWLFYKQDEIQSRKDEERRAKYWERVWDSCDHFYLEPNKTGEPAKPDKLYKLGKVTCSNPAFKKEGWECPYCEGKLFRVAYADDCPSHTEYGCVKCGEIGTDLLFCDPCEKQESKSCE